MMNKKLSRRDFLRMSSLAAAGAALAGCTCPSDGDGAEATQPPAADATTAPADATTAPKPDTVVLEIGASNPEYENAERQIWEVFEDANPGVTVEMFSVNEDQRPTFRTRVAGGYVPAMAPSYSFVDSLDAGTIDQFLDLSTIDCPYWDRFLHDPINKVPEIFGWGARTIYLSAPHVFTWMYHADLMEEAGLDPRNDVKTWDDMFEWLDAGSEWAASNPDVDYFWDNAWHSGAVSNHQVRAMTLAFPDGQQEDDLACYMDNANYPMNAADSPFRHTFEFFATAYERGWLPENWWTREWEADMEASYIAKKSVMMLHGPWPWDKMLAADPDAVQLGLPCTPPAEGQDQWVNYQGNTRYNSGQVAILAAAADVPEFDLIKEAFCWYHSPEVVVMRSQVLGRMPNYRLDEPLELTGGQFVGVVKDIGTSGGAFEDVQLVDGTWGTQAAEPYRIPGSVGMWDQPGAGLLPLLADHATGDGTLQDILDFGQSTFEESYDIM